MTHDTKTSTHLTALEHSKLRDGVVRSLELGLPLNWFLTIHLARGRVEHPKEFVSAFLSSFQDFLRTRNCGPLCRIGVMEAKGGLHVHLALHVPQHLLARFQELVPAWCERAGADCGRGVLKGIPVRYSELDYVRGYNFKKYLRHGILGLLRYFSKGIEPDEAERFGIRPRDQGLVTGKRIVCSQFWSIQTSGLGFDGEHTLAQLHAQIAEHCPELLVCDPRYARRRDRLRHRRAFRSRSSSSGDFLITATRALCQDDLGMEGNQPSRSVQPTLLCYLKLPVACDLLAPRVKG